MTSRVTWPVARWLGHDGCSPWKRCGEGCGGAGLGVQVRAAPWPAPLQPLWQTGNSENKGRFGAETVHETWTLGDIESDYLFYRSGETFPVSRTRILMAASVSSGCCYSHPETDYGNGWNSGVILLTRGWVAAGQALCFPLTTCGALCAQPPDDKTPTLLVAALPCSETLGSPSFLFF